ncbi:IS3 family transposase [Miltoncostaea oceani]|uniref:IS3 family transposase n=1 Tax=Miltoncostaea oceani TaxID=2843216 RepID=UPI001C3C285C
MRRREDDQLLERLRAVHLMSRGTYGAACVHAELAADGHCHGRKRIARLRREAGIEGTTAAASSAPPSVTRCELQPRIWSSDASSPSDRTRCGWPTSPTCGPGPGWLYVAVVLTPAAAGVVGWSMLEDLRAEPVVDAIQMASWRRQVHEAPLVHHSDRGSQCTSSHCGRTLREAGIAQSVGSRGDAYDYALSPSRSCRR